MLLKWLDFVSQVEAKLRRQGVDPDKTFVASINLSNVDSLANWVDVTSDSTNAPDVYVIDID